MKSADVIIPHIESYVHKYAWTPWGKVQVRAAELGNSAVLMGAHCCPAIAECAGSK
jgi:glucokinase